MQADQTWLLLMRTCSREMVRGGMSAPRGGIRVSWTSCRPLLLTMLCRSALEKNKRYLSPVADASEQSLTRAALEQLILVLLSG